MTGGYSPKPFPQSCPRRLDMAGWQRAAHVYIRNDRRYKLNTEVRGSNASWTSWRVRRVKGKRTSALTAGSDLADLQVNPTRRVCSSVALASFTVNCKTSMQMN